LLPPGSGAEAPLWALKELAGWNKAWDVQSSSLVMSLSDLQVKLDSSADIAKAPLKFILKNCKPQKFLSALGSSKLLILLLLV